jgi:uncharacterized LabA/DUF88 family protein
MVPKFQRIFVNFVTGRQIMRMYFYTVQQHLATAKAVHGADCFEGLRLVMGEGIVKADGNIKEKGVDALLVADLIYHSATRNCDYALVVTVDTDFVHALRRVEDFGCGTGVLGVCSQVPERLRNSSDEYFELTGDEMLRDGLARRI